MNKIFRLYILLVVFFTAGFLAYADDSNSVDQATVKCDQDCQALASEYYQKGVDLANEGKLDEARSYFEKSIHLSNATAAPKPVEVKVQQPVAVPIPVSAPVPVSSPVPVPAPQVVNLPVEIKKKEPTVDLNQQAEVIYAQAVSLYKNRQFAQAQQKFEAVGLVVPNYKSTQYYLRKIDNKIKEAQADEQRQNELAQERQRAQELKDQTDQTEKLYAQGISLYRDRQYDAAKDEFLKVKDRDPDYRSTKYYLSKIDDKIQETQEEQMYQKKLAQEHQQAQMLRDKINQTEKIYEQALSSYRDHQWVEARAQFESVEGMIPDFKHTRRYLDKIDAFIAQAAQVKQAVVPLPAPVVLPLPAPVPTPVPQAPVAVVTASLPAPQTKVVVSLDDQQKQAQEIAELAERSAKLYSQIADIADDNSTLQTKKKMAQVDEILVNLKENKERLLRQMQEDQIKRQQAEIEEMYQDAVESLRQHEYAKAKVKFLELENNVPGYKNTRRYLSRIEEDLKQEGVEAITAHEQEETEHLKQVQDKENAEVLRHAQEEQEKQNVIVQQQQASLKELAQKASDINDDIIRLSYQQDYPAMKAKFAELESTVSSLTALKEEMAKEKDIQEHLQESVRESMSSHEAALKAQNQVVGQIQAYNTTVSLKENRPQSQPASVDQFKRREILQEQDNLFSEGVSCYEHRKYTEAKLLFGELADQHDRRAEPWLTKVDRAITRELLASEVGEEKERTAFIADQLKAQHELAIIQERERQRQKLLNEELERQKRIYEDDQQMELRKEETLKAQERERERQEAKRAQLEKASERQQEEFRFHKVKIVVHSQPMKSPQVQSTAVVTPVVPVVTASAAPTVAPPVATAPTKVDIEAAYQNAVNLYLQKELGPAKEAFEDVNKMAPDYRATPNYLKMIDQEMSIAQERERIKEEKQKQEEEREQLKAKREEEREARIKAEADAREKIKEDKQKEKEHEEQLKAQREEDRQAKIKADQDAQAKEEQEREEKAKQDQMMREEAQHRQDLENEERQSQAQLEARREAIRKQLEDGVEAMYQDALNLYQQGDYPAAADRFKDVQDILPGYKRSEEYMNDARQKASIVKPQVVNIPAPAVVDDTPAASTNTPTPTAAAPASPQVSHEDDASKALDLFDPNAK